MCAFAGCRCCWAELAVGGGASWAGFWLIPLDVFLSLLPSPDPFLSLDPLAVFSLERFLSLLPILSLEPSPALPLLAAPLAVPVPLVKT